MYEVIAEPPSSGATQFRITLSGLQVVVGLSGLAGIYDDRMLTVFEKKLKPYWFLTSTLSKYSSPWTVFVTV